MDELKFKEAYERLGLPENASREQVEQRFEILLRQSRSRSMQHSKTGDESGNDDFEQVVKAYRYITESEDRQKYDELTRQKYAKYKGMAGTVEKIDDFFRLYKVHVIVSLIALVLIIVGLNSYLNHQEEKRYLASLPPIDLSVVVIGNFAIENGGDDEELETAILTQFPDWKRTSVNLTYLPMQEESMTNIAYQQKAMLVLTTEKPDIYIMDKESFDWVASSGVLRPLDEVVETSLQPLLTPNLIMEKQREDDEKPHVYGIDLSSSSLSDGLPMFRHDGDLITGIRYEATNEKQALHFIQEYLENIK